MGKEELAKKLFSDRMLANGWQEASDIALARGLEQRFAAGGEIRLKLHTDKWKRAWYLFPT